MGSDFDTKAAPNLYLAVMNRFGTLRAAKNSLGQTVVVTLKVLSDSVDVERGELGRDSVQRSRIGVLTSSDVDDSWEFDVLGDGNFWVVDRDGQGIMRYNDGMFLVPVIRSPIYERGEPDYHGAA